MSYLQSILFNKAPPEVGRLSDIEFLMIKEFDGKLRKNEGTISVTGTLATLTAATGKDLYLARAKVSIRMLSTSVAANCVIELQVNGVVVETFIFLVAEASGSAGWVAVVDDHYEFKNIGHKVDAAQVIRLEVTVESNCVIEGTIECVEEDDGVSPAI